MQQPLLKGLFLLCLWQKVAHAEAIPDVSFHFSPQWNIGDQNRQRLQAKYGSFRVSFDKEGRAIPHGLFPKQMPRWERLYKLCMSDGCYFCDSEKGGSCEMGTCGYKNVDCRPYLGGDGLPQCGLECADYAFLSILN